MEAVYEDRTLKLPRELPLQQGQNVTITIHLTGGPVRRRRGLIQWKGSLKDLDHLITSADNDPLEAP
jgi:predicted DNA-binding antitoxin AbrB/MazE fold protein